MTQDNYTHLTFVIDRSGSMRPLATDMTGGVNTMIAEQFAEAGRLTLTLVDFDNTYSTVERMADKPFEYNLVPRGNTALLDAVGAEIIRTGEDLAALPEDQRPGRVLFVVVTDGEENSSREFTLERVQELIATQRERFEWQFQFLGAEESAWQADQLGMKRTRFNANGRSSRRTMDVFNESMKEYRSKPAFDKDFLMDEEVDD